MIRTAPAAIFTARRAVVVALVLFLGFVVLSAVGALTAPSERQAWIMVESLVGIGFMGVCLIRRRLSYWPVVLALLLGDLFRALAGGAGGWSPGVWGIAFGGSLPFVPGIVLFVFYASFALVPLAVLVFSDRQSAKAAAVTALVDGIIHLALPVKPPWMVGASTRWAAGQPFLSSTVAQDVNPVAAFPSLHVALPASQKWNWWAIAISLAVVLLGEHWLVDVLGGWALGLGSRAFVRRFWPEAAPAEETTSEFASEEADRLAA